MMRYRRYRVFLLAAAITIFLIFRLSQPSNWQSSAPTVGAIRDHLGHLGLHPGGISHADEKNDPSHVVHNPVPNPLPDRIRPPTVPSTVPKPVQRTLPNRVPPKHMPTSTTLPNGSIRIDDGKDGVRIIPQPSTGDAGEIVLAEGGEGRWSQDHLPSQAPEVRWSQMPDHYPVPTESFHALPTGQSKPIPKIQHKFLPQSAADEKERKQRLGVIKEAFLHAWKGYKDEAWGKDELKPVSGGSKDTFNGWAATLVDSLDTMWIMGLKDEFEEAVEFVKTIDFQTSARSNIPLFETTIRYLGGLLGAYDVSGGKYKVLLDKATELGDVLMGAFDTPNRFPQTYYQWRPAFASQPHRAPSRVVLAEIGSLQMEFTRLSQLTKNSKYYDAVARIVDELDAWQNKTELPGMWPADIDTSGCAKHRPENYRAPSRNSDGTFAQVAVPKPESPKMEPLKKPDPITVAAVDRSPGKADGAKLPEPFAVDIDEAILPSKKDGPTRDMQPLKKPDPLLFTVKTPKGANRKRQAESVPNVPVPNLAFPSRERVEPVDIVPPECIPSGLESASYGLEKFTLGSTADSAFEYLSKQYILLGGQVEQYRPMYEKALDVANEKLIFRVMIPDEKREILVSGEYMMSSHSSHYETSRLDPEGSHLTCFVGGMFAMGAKLFDRPQDLDIAAKLTDGCIWAYESMATGIMPERFEAVRCDDRKSCAWNETKWFEELDPSSEMRLELYQQQLEIYRSETASAAASAKAAATKPASGPLAVVTEAQDSARNPPPEFAIENKAGREHYAAHSKRQLDSVPANVKAGDSKPPSPTVDDVLETEFVPPSQVVDAPPPVWSPTKPLTRDEFAKSRIESERLVPGLRQINDPRYILRPEALESVFYMHRITGQEYWRKAGWKMVAAILKHTRTPLGHSAIKDVTVDTPAFENNMESFWLAETLKYAWLLFDDEENWSLDDWVLNTEAHLFKRPAPAGK